MYSGQGWEATSRSKCHVYSSATHCRLASVSFQKKNSKHVHSSSLFESYSGLIYKVIQVFPSRFWSQIGCFQIQSSLSFKVLKSAVALSPPRRFTPNSRPMLHKCFQFDPASRIQIMEAMATGRGGGKRAEKPLSDLHGEFAKITRLRWDVVTTCYNMLQGSWCEQPRLLLRLEDMAFLAETDHDIVVGELTGWGGSNSHNMMVQVLNWASPQFFPKLGLLKAIENHRSVFHGHIMGSKANGHPIIMGIPFIRRVMSSPQTPAENQAWPIDPLTHRQGVA